MFSTMFLTIRACSIFEDWCPNMIGDVRAWARLESICSLTCPNMAKFERIIGSDVCRSHVRTLWRSESTCLLLCVLLSKHEGMIKHETLIMSKHAYDIFECRHAKSIFKLILKVVLLIVW